MRSKKYDDLATFHDHMKTAQHTIWAARIYARDGNVEAAMNCIRIAGSQRRIAKQFLKPAYPGAWS